MFTGIIQHVGKVRESGPSPSGRRLVIDAGPWSHAPLTGESIAVNGCCLTVARPPSAGSGLLVFDVVPETLARTTLGDLSPGAPVNLEHAATPSTLLGGHVVQGHIDAVGRVTAIDTAGGGHVIRVEVPAAAAEFITPKGSIAIEGVSLTVASVEPGRGTGVWSLCVALIPTTLRETTLGSLRISDPVNIETDILARTVVHWLRCFRGRAGDRAEGETGVREAP